MDPITLSLKVDGEDFTAAGGASLELKRLLKSLGLPSDVIRRASICMYEGEINMVIHADGGDARVLITTDDIEITLADRGPGIPDVDLAMQEGWSTATETVRNLGFGAGMGLPNMKRHADEMKIETEIGVGTTITMTIHLTVPGGSL